MALLILVLLIRRKRRIGLKDIMLSKITVKGPLRLDFSGVISLCEVSMNKDAKSLVAAKQHQDTPEDADRFRQDLHLLQKLGKHENVVALIAQCSAAVPPMIIYELCSNGNLRDYLRSFRSNKILAHQTKLEFCRDVASGMCFLAAKNVIHGDLAARSVLVDETQVCKIFDVSRLRPAAHATASHRWMSPEFLQHNLLNRGSDLWAYGVVVWEILTLGATPFPKVDDEAVKAHILAGNRLSCPKNVTEKVFRICQSCWVDVPSKRLPFGSILSIIDDLLLTSIESPEAIEMLPIVSAVEEPGVKTSKSENSRHSDSPSAKMSSSSSLGYLETTRLSGVSRPSASSINRPMYVRPLNRSNSGYLMIDNEEGDYEAITQLPEAQLVDDEHEYMYDMDINAQLAEKHDYEYSTRPGVSSFIAAHEHSVWLTEKARKGKDNDEIQGVGDSKTDWSPNSTPNRSSSEGPEYDRVMEAKDMPINVDQLKPVQSASSGSISSKNTSEHSYELPSAKHSASKSSILSKQRLSSLYETIDENQDQTLVKSKPTSPSVVPITSKPAPRSKFSKASTKSERTYEEPSSDGNKYATTINTNPSKFAGKSSDDTQKLLPRRSQQTLPKIPTDQLQMEPEYSDIKESMAGSTSTGVSLKVGGDGYGWIAKKDQSRTERPDDEDEEEQEQYGFGDDSSPTGMYETATSKAAQQHSHYAPVENFDTFRSRPQEEVVFAKGVVNLPVSTESTSSNRSSEYVAIPDKAQQQQVYTTVEHADTFKPKAAELGNILFETPKDGAVVSIAGKKGKDATYIPTADQVPSAITYTPVESMDTFRPKVQSMVLDKGPGNVKKPTK